ncbi:MAG TPA: hypothetical protein VG986_12065 [Pseudolabrys sp.]|nr:hypothetical protein [Pseudolabrys sp.]
MDVLLHITTPDAARIAAPLARALSAQGASWGCFLTNDGVRSLDDNAFSAVLSKAERVAVCEHSWQLHMTGRLCPVEQGSQTINSALMADARRVVSL